MALDEEHLGVGRLCPHCGRRSDTLGDICPTCNKPYSPGGGLLDRLPFPDDFFVNRYGVELMLIVGFGLALLAVWLLFTHPVAGILAVAALFVLFIAAVGAANALSDRGR
jgi:hypothetical protein